MRDVDEEFAATEFLFKGLAMTSNTTAVRPSEQAKAPEQAQLTRTSLEALVGKVGEVEDATGRKYALKPITMRDLAEFARRIKPASVHAFINQGLDYDDAEAMLTFLWISARRGLPQGEPELKLDDWLSRFNLGSIERIGTAVINLCMASGLASLALEKIPKGDGANPTPAPVAAGPA
jgi:hypothetical protein